MKTIITKVLLGVAGLAVAAGAAKALRAAGIKAA